jgi:predicted alpha/beta superfamily hydrolase
MDMKPEKLVVCAVAVVTALAVLGSCARSVGPAYPPGRIKQYQVPAGKLSMNLSVYLPGDYDESGSRYPVLYLLHGDDGNDRTFFGAGYPTYGGAMSEANAGAVMDGLLRQGKIKPFIVACPDLASEGDLLRYFVPFVDATLRTVPRRELRAIVGHSSGGYYAMDVSLNHPEVFSVACGLAPSALLSITPAIDTAQGLKSNPVSYWLYAGKKDTIAVAWTVRDFARSLRKNGQSAIYVEDDGDHISKVAARLPQLIEFLSNRLARE